MPELETRTDRADGSYDLARWRDEAGNPVDRQRAEQVEITSFDPEGNEVERTYAQLGPPTESTGGAGPDYAKYVWQSGEVELEQ